MAQEVEKCVLCEHETEVVEGTPIYLREHFIDGSGQLCESCFEEIGSNIDWHNLA